MLQRSQRLVNDPQLPIQIAATIAALGVRLSDVASGQNQLALMLDRHPSYVEALNTVVADADNEEE